MNMSRMNIVNFNFDNFISIHTKQLVLGLTAFFLSKFQFYNSILIFTKQLVYD